MPGKNITIRAEELDKKIKQLQAQKQLLLNRAKEKERKDRTRRLIQIGGVMNMIGMLSLDQANAFKDKVLGDEKIRTWFDKLMADYSPAAQDENPEQNGE